jgi:hypothetical protein
LENGETKSLINKPNSDSKGDEPKETKGGTPSFTNATVSPNVPASTGYQEATQPAKANQHREYGMRMLITAWRSITRRFMGVIGFLDKYSGAVTALATVAIVVLTVFYVKYSKQQWETMRDTLQTSQRAYITLGRRDGVVAEFAIPKDPKDNAGIVIYFQNGGHLPARFDWGLLYPITVIPPMPDFPPIESRHRFSPLTRTRNRKTGARGEGEGGTIAGDSVYNADVVELPEERVLQLSHMNRIFEIWGAFEYCDALGGYSCREFTIYYQGSPYNRFRLVRDSECPVFMRTPPLLTDPDTEYLPPCQTAAEQEEERQIEDKQFVEFQRREAAKKKDAPKP